MSPAVVKVIRKTFILWPADTNKKIRMSFELLVNRQSLKTQVQVGKKSFLWWVEISSVAMLALSSLQTFAKQVLSHYVGTLTHLFA